MKLKALALALVAASAATTANAVEVYSKDGATVTVGGAVEVQIVQSAGSDDSDKSFTYDEASLTVEGDYAAGFGGVSYDLTAEELSDAYIGLKLGSAVKVLFGKTDLPADNFGSDASIEGNSSSFSAFAADASDKQVQLMGDFGPVSLAVATEVDGDLDIDVFASTSFGPVDLGLGYQDYAGEDTFGVSLATSLGPVGLGLDYSDNDSTTVTHVSGSFSMFGFGYDIAESGDDEVKSYYLNATKSLGDNIDVYAEIDNTDESGSDMGYLIGGIVTL